MPVFSSPSRTSEHPVHTAECGAALRRRRPQCLLPQLHGSRSARLRCGISSSFISTSVAAPTLMTATPPAKFRQTLLKFFFIKIGSGFFHLGADLFDPGLRWHRQRRSPCTMVVSSLETRIFSALPRSSSVTPSSLRPTSSEITVPPVRIAISCSIALRRSPKAGSFNSNSLEGAAQLVDDEGGKSFAFHVFSNDQEFLALLDNFLEYREQDRQ